MEPVAPAVEARSLNHWTTREVPPHLYFTEWIYHNLFGQLANFLLIDIYIFSSLLLL